MINRSTKLRLRRKIKRSRSQVENIGHDAEAQLDRHFFRKLNRLSNVRRFIGSWVLLLLILVLITIFQTFSLSSYYQTLKPAPGGTYEEGIVGTLTNANPIFATSDVDLSVSRLMFPGLLKYDQSNHLVGDLAKTWTSNKDGNVYNFTLRDGLKWQDNTPLTADDVVFTYNTIQNPDVQSPLFSSWRNIKITALDSRTIQFILPNPLSSFTTSATNGIIPAHVLNGISPAQMRSASFNTVNPVGSGPFKLSVVDVSGNTPTNYLQKIGLVPNSYYYAGQPKLDDFVINAFNNQAQMLKAFSKGEINSMSGLTSLPAKIASDTSVYSYNVPLTSEVMVFFKNSHAILSDVKVRQALVQASDVDSIVSGLGYPAIVSKSPLLPFQIGYDPHILQHPYNLATANQLLTQDGWILNKNGLRMKNNTPLQFSLVTQDNSEFKYVSQALAAEWQKVGADVQVIPQQTSDLHATLGNHGYDSILYGISIGTDPDVFPYWDSSQASPASIPGLNLSEYKSSIADRALAEGRTRTNPMIRAAKYKTFLQAWQGDAPALALYQPRFLYVTQGQLFGFNPVMLNYSTDRYSNVRNWEIRQVETSNKN